MRDRRARGPAASILSCQDDFRLGRHPGATLRTPKEGGFGQQDRHVGTTRKNIFAEGIDRFCFFML